MASVPPAALRSRPCLVSFVWKETNDLFYSVTISYLRNTALQRVVFFFFQFSFCFIFKKIYYLRQDLYIVLLAALEFTV